MLNFYDISDGVEWNEIVNSFPSAHILQSWEWGLIKSQHGWIPKRICWKTPDGQIKAAAQVLIREIHLLKKAISIRISYVPRGPLLDWSDVTLSKIVLDDIVSFAKKQRSFFVKIDPEAVVSFQPDNPDLEYIKRIFSDWQKYLEKWNWIYSEEQVQFPNSIVLNLQLSQEALLSKMKQKTRYNIRLAEKKGVEIKKCTLEDLPMLYWLYKKTSERDNFIIRPKDYYLTAWSTMITSGGGIAFMAYFENEPIGGLILFKTKFKSWYFYGMSGSAHRDKMPNHLLQWEAIKAAQAEGCSTYDFWGAPDINDPNDRLWGVFRFKEGFSGNYYQTIGAWDYIINPVIYFFYKKMLPLITGILKIIKYGQREQKSIRAISNES